MAKLEPIMDAPIPGQSLTTELGSRPWQQPAKYTNVEDALEFYAKKITDPSINDSLLNSLEMGTPVSSAAEVIVLTSSMEGMHTIDVSILLLPVVMELIAYVADEAGIEYDMGLNKKIDQDIISEGEIDLAIKKIKDKMPKDNEEETTRMPLSAEKNKAEEVEEETEEETEPTGLMARETPTETAEIIPEESPSTGSLMSRRV